MATRIAPGQGLPAATTTRGLARLWDRKLAHYPAPAARSVYLGITVVATIAMYYALYLQGAVATQLLSRYHFSFAQFVYVAVIGNAVGAFASLFAGLADRWGRANLVVGGLLVNGLLIAFAVPSASSKLAFTVAIAVVSLIEGMALVATPALIRDFSPQVGRGAAMGLWAMGPVLGSLAVTEIASHTLDAHPSWEWQYQLCGAVVLVIGLIALVGLRELAPGLRDQLMVTSRDRALIEARAAGLDEKRALDGHWRQMLSFQILGPAVAIALFLIPYLIVVGFGVIYLATTFGYTEAAANSLANWFWITQAVALAISGLASDKVRVRKPFVLAGALISPIGVALLASAATHPGTSRSTFILCFLIMGAGTGLAYAAWMAAFTETIEKRNPAATATGLAVWGWTVRIVLMMFLAFLPVAVKATTTLVDKGPGVKAIVARYPTQVGVLKAVDATTLTALQRNPRDQAAQARALSKLSRLPAADVATVVKAGPKVQHAGDRLRSLSKVPAADLAYLSEHGARVNEIAARYPAQIKVVQRVGPSTMAKLGRNAGDTTAQADALSQLSGLPVATVSTVVSNGTAVQAAGNRLKSVSAIPAADLQELSVYGNSVNAILGRYPAQVKVLQSIDASTMTTLGKNPHDAAAQARALSQLSGLSTSAVAKVIRLSTQDKDELGTARAIDPATAGALAKDRTDVAAITKAVGEIANRFGISKAAATQRLVALAGVPPGDLAFLQANGPKVQAAGNRLKSVSAIPKAELGVLAKHGPRVQRIVSSYPAQVQVLKTVDASTMRALSQNPNDFGAQTRALSELSGLPTGIVAAVVADGPEVQAAGAELKSVATVPVKDLNYLGTHAPRVQRIATRHPAQIDVLEKVDAVTMGALNTNRHDAAAQASALSQLSGLRPNVVAKVLSAGPRVQKAGARLRSLSKMPAPAIGYLAANAATTAAAAKDNPHQWQRWWWICFVAQLVFIPFVFALGGRWSPRKAREDQREHELLVARELAALQARTS